MRPGGGSVRSKLVLALPSNVESRWPRVKGWLSMRFTGSYSVVGTRMILCLASKKVLTMSASHLAMTVLSLSYSSTTLSSSNPA